MSLDPALLTPALVAGLIVLATHVPLGQQVLARGIVFLDLAVAQIAGIGAIAAHLADHAPSPWLVQAAAAGAACLGSLAFTWTERRWPQMQEALIGTAFVLAASGAILLLAGDPHAGELLHELLAGQILWVGSRELVPAGVLSALVLAALLVLGERLPRAGFYLLFALAVTTSVQLVGVYLVFASLIIPALAARGRRHALASGWAVGAAGYAAGLALSGWFDLPAGPLVVWSLAGAALATAPLPRRGAGGAPL